MASFNNPKITNQILTDVPEIQELLGYLAQCRPDQASDFPDGTVRFWQHEPTANRWVFQYFKEGAWANVESIFVDATSLRGYQPSENAAAGRIPVYDSSGKLVGNITGTAATATKLATPRQIQVGGIASSTAQNFDGSAPVTIPINQITVNNSADNALNGVVTKAHGGTGRADGASSDIVVSGISGDFLAKSKGQIGSAKVLEAGVHADSVVERGLYILQGQEGIAQGWPIDITSPVFVSVDQQGAYVTQYLKDRNSLWMRYSTNAAASWAGWWPIGGLYGGIVIYVSKSGSDLNTGLSSSYPVLTINRALQIAANLTTLFTQQTITLALGAGNWGTLVLHGLPFLLQITPYDVSAPSAYSTSLPVFDLINTYGSTTLSITGCVVDKLYTQDGSNIQVGASYKRFGTIAAWNGGLIKLYGNATNNLTEFYGGSNATGNIIIYENGTLIIEQNQTFKLGNNQTLNQFLYLTRGGKIICPNFNSIAFQSSSFTFTGNKYHVDQGGGVYGPGGQTFLNSLPGTSSTLSNLAVIDGKPNGVPLSSEVVKKSGDLMSGNLIIKNADPVFCARSSVDVYNATPSAMRFYHPSWAEDLNGSTVGGDYIYHQPNGNFTNEKVVIGQDGTWAQLKVIAQPDGVHYGTCPTPPAGAHNVQIATCEWVVALLNTNSANEVPIGTICPYEGTFTRALDAAVFFEQEIKAISESLKNEQQAARMMRMTRSVKEPTDQIFELDELESRIFQLAYWKEFYKEMLDRIPENDGVRLYDAKGDIISDPVSYPEFQIMGRAFPNTKWNQYSPGARVLIGTDANHAYGTTGGAATHAHGMSGSVSESTLDQTHIPTHAHTITAYNPAISSANVGHGGGTSYTNVSSGVAGYSMPHGHGNTFAVGNASSYPPYKAVYWIKKVA